MIKTQLTDPQTGNKAKVLGTGAQLVSVSEPSANDLTLEQLTQLKWSAVNFTNSGSEDLNVDGSVTPVEFTIESVSTSVFFLQKVRFIFHSGDMDFSAGQDIRKFGAAAGTAGLTNGLEFESFQGGIIEPVFLTPIQRMTDFLSYVDDFINVVQGIGVTTDFATFDFSFFQPIVLPADALDKLTICVRDDLTALTLFQVIGTGWKEVL